MDGSGKIWMNGETGNELPERLPKEPLAASVARGLREAIMEGDLKPDDRVKQQEVAQRYGVSRSPVREAFLELASEGFVELERDVGARVRGFDTDEVIQLYLAREALEPVMIAETCRRITPEQMAEARALNEESEVFAADGDIAGYLRIDTEMHRVLLEASGMTLLTEMTQSLWRRTHRYRFAYSVSSRVDTSVLEHRMILDAIEAGDAADASDLYRIHTRRTRLTLAEESRSTDGEAPDGVWPHNQEEHS